MSTSLDCRIYTETLGESWFGKVEKGLIVCYTATFFK